MATWNSNNQHGFAAQEVAQVIPGAVYQIRDPEPSAISLMMTGSDEMLRITQDGFYVRGVKIPQDNKEPETVYLAFKQWLAWANLQQ